jgi:hypothetical protein
VTFPAYAGATAGMRSMTDDFLQRCFERDPGRLREMFEQATDLRADEPAEQDDAPSTTDAASRTSGPERRVTPSGRGPLALPVPPSGPGSTSPIARRPHGRSDDGRGTSGAHHRDPRTPGGTRHRVPWHDVHRRRQDRVRAARRGTRRSRARDRRARAAQVLPRRAGAGHPQPGAGRALPDPPARRRARRRHLRPDDDPFVVREPDGGSPRTARPREAVDRERDVR